MTVAPPHLQWLDDPCQPPADPTRPACWVIDSSRHPGQSATVVRQVLGMQLGIPAEAVELETDALGRRVLSLSTTRTASRALTLDFSVSHCLGTLVIGVCSGGRIGVDVEVQAPAGWEAAARDCLTHQEQRWLQGTVDRTAAFLRLWTAKEAIAKALGLGLQADFIGIELQPRDERLHVLRVQHSESMAAGWTLDSMDLVTPAGQGIVTVATIQ